VIGPPAAVLSYAGSLWQGRAMHLHSRSLAQRVAEALEGAIPKGTYPELPPLPRSPRRANHGSGA